MEDSAQPTAPNWKSRIDDVWEQRKLTSCQFRGPTFDSETSNQLVSIRIRIILFYYMQPMEMAGYPFPTHPLAQITFVSFQLSSARCSAHDSKRLSLKQQLSSIPLSRTIVFSGLFQDSLFWLKAEATSQGSFNNAPGSFVAGLHPNRPSANLVDNRNRRSMGQNMLGPR